MANAPTLQGAEFRASEGGIRVWGVGAVPGWRVDLHKAGSGELLGAGPVDANGYFNFVANYAQMPKGSYPVQVRQTNNSETSYWSQTVQVSVS
ncbi:hypothetical protein [Pseudomonas sp. ok266]|uniref:hypothetical protein n=1 Tax=Pseudomonas sp. ok266 TaxID=1761896 RepID=UPI0011139B7A|nr:hypothetical protein [Pseudomonas sp. ok266]